jgi:hypothetical protein
MPPSPPSLLLLSRPRGAPEGRRGAGSTSCSRPPRTTDPSGHITPSTTQCSSPQRNHAPASSRSVSPTPHARCIDTVHRYTSHYLITLTISSLRSLTILAAVLSLSIDLSRSHPLPPYSFSSLEHSLYSAIDISMTLCELL